MYGWLSVKVASSCKGQEVVGNYDNPYPVGQEVVESYNRPHPEKTGSCRKS